MQFTAFLDEVGAETASANVLGREVRINLGLFQSQTYKPVGIRPISVGGNDPTLAKRAAIGYLALGGAGAAAGALMGRGPVVHFAIDTAEGVPIYGLCRQRDYRQLRLNVERASKPTHLEFIWGVATALLNAVRAR